MCVLSQPVDPSDLSCSVRALQQDLDELKSVNESLRKENHNLREQLNTARNGNKNIHEFVVSIPKNWKNYHTYDFGSFWLALSETHTHTHFSLLVLGGEGARSRSVRPSCDAEFARALKVFYHSMTSVRGQLQRLRRHRPSVRIHVLSSVLAWVSVTTMWTCLKSLI